MISICVNGEKELRAACSLLDLLGEKRIAPERVVLELNGAIVKRPQWGEVRLHDGDVLEIVCFVGGG